MSWFSRQIVCKAEARDDKGWRYGSAFLSQIFCQCWEEVGAGEVKNRVRGEHPSAHRAPLYCSPVVSRTSRKI